MLLEAENDNCLGAIFKSGRTRRLFNNDDATPSVNSAVWLTAPGVTSGTTATESITSGTIHRDARNAPPPASPRMAATATHCRTPWRIGVTARGTVMLLLSRWRPDKSTNRSRAL